jgi:hypothetical protein
MSDYHNNKPFKPTKSGIAKKVIGTVTDFFKSRGKKVSPTITSVKPGTTFKGTPKYQKDIIETRSAVQKKFKPIQEGIANETRQIRQKLQGMRGERITQSGISKGKDVTPKIYTEKKAKGGRIGYKRGTGLMPKKKSNVDKIKKTFGPKSLGMQSVIYGLDKNKNVTAADPKAKFIAAAKKKKKKVI